MSKSIESKDVVGPDINLDRTVVLDKDGSRITERRARVIAREVVNSVGRPSLTAPATHSPEVKARVPKKLKVALEKEAKRRGQTPSALLRQVLEEFFARS